MACLRCSPRDRGDPSAATKEVLLGPHAERAGPYSCADPHWTLEVGSVPHEDSKESGRSMLVLQWAGENDTLTCVAPLPGSQTPGSQSGGMGRRGTRRCPGLASQSRWERWFVKFLELSGVGRVMADGMDEDEDRATRMGEWVMWETVGRSTPRG
jgi:hypothetical protein